MASLRPDSFRCRRLLVGLWIGACFALPSCRGPESAPESEPRLNVLVITLDTIRTDRLGAYGNTRVRTPFVDDLADRGVVFDRCIAPTPLTLPSHASVFTGSYPVFHGVRDNGSSVVPEQLTTMAELFSDAGYRTAGFVGAYVLGARWGLDQGFQTFTEPRSGFDPARVSFAQVQRRADEVVDDAIAWIERDPETPFFSWVHLYDPHLPYDPPAPFAVDYADDPYLGEVAFADAEMARLGAFLSSAGLDSRTVIIFAGDHGEGLGDHDEIDHGLLLYQTTARVPLIISHPLAPSGTVRRPEVVSLVDILPTVTDAFGLPTPAEVQGRSLLPLVLGNGAFEETPVLAETRYPQLHFGWSPLTALQNRRYQLIRSSEPELYDLDRDPGQHDNIIAARPEIAERMGRELDLMVDRLERGAMTASKAADAATIAKLRALGYLAGNAAPTDQGSANDLPSPKSMLPLYNRLMEANNALIAGDLAEGERQLVELVRTNGELVDAWAALGQLYRRQGRMAESLAALRTAHERRPLDPSLVSKLAEAQISTGRLGDAESLLSAALEAHPDDPAIVFAMARVLERTGRIAEAEAMYRRSLTLDPLSAAAHVRLGALALQRGDTTAAGSELDAALRLDPSAPEAGLFMGQLLEQQGRTDEAAQAYRDELEAMPGSLPAAMALSRLEGRRGRPAEQERVLRAAIEANPRSPGPHLVLALTFLQRNERLPEAVELAERGLDCGPTGPELRMAHVLLAELYNRLGDRERALEHARTAEQTR